MEQRHNVLFLTNNPNLCSTSRILQRWLVLGRREAFCGHTVLREQGDFAEWLAHQRLSYLIDPLPWPDRRRPWHGLWHAWRVARWARRKQVNLIHCNEHDVYPFVPLLRRMMRLPAVCHVRFVVTRAFAEWAFGGSGRAPDALLWTFFQQKQDCEAAVRGLVPEDRQHVVRLGIDLDCFGQLVRLRDQTRAGW